MPPLRQTPLRRGLERMLGQLACKHVARLVPNLRRTCIVGRCTWTSISSGSNIPGSVLSELSVDFLETFRVSVDFVHGFAAEANNNTAAFLLDQIDPGTCFFSCDALDKALVTCARHSRQCRVGHSRILFA